MVFAHVFYSFYLRSFLNFLSFLYCNFLRFSWFPPEAQLRFTYRCALWKRSKLVCIWNEPRATNKLQGLLWNVLDSLQTILSSRQRQRCWFTHLCFMRYFMHDIPERVIRCKSRITSSNLTTSFLWEQLTQPAYIQTYLPLHGIHENMMS
jgi:hypothetical protein